MTVLTNEQSLPYEKAREIILREIFSQDVRVSGEYFRLFKEDVHMFADSMARAVEAWQPLDQDQHNEERMYVAALASGAASLHVGSMTLFMAGHTVAAGNLMRQVIEMMALTLLCSGHDLPYRKQFMEDNYQTTNAVKDLEEHSVHLHLRSDGVEALKQARRFYHKYSHPTRLTLATQISFSGEGAYVGACFDPGKENEYRKEVVGRVGLAEVFISFVEAVKANMTAWPKSG